MGHVTLLRFRSMMTSVSDEQ